MSSFSNTMPRLTRRASPNWSIYAELSMLHLVDQRAESESSYDTHDLPPDVRDLHNLLSPDTKTPCAPLPAPNPNPLLDPPFVKIGSGRRADVFAQGDGSGGGAGGPGPAAVKLCKTHNHAELWEEYVRHAKIARQFALYLAGDEAVGVPAAYYFVPPGTFGFFSLRPGLAEAAQPTCPLPTSAFVMQRVPPLARRVCQLLMERFCPTRALPAARGRPDNNAFVVRVLLGSEAAPLGGGLRRHWRGERMRECAVLRLSDMAGLYLDVRALARGMGAALAVLHWAAGTDARGVEFVLGSSRRTVSCAPEPRGLGRLPPMTNTGPETMWHEDFFYEVESTKLWVLDFDRVRPIGLDEAGVKQAVEAAVENEPYLPRPLGESRDDKDLWAAFAVSYVEAARVILDVAEAEVARLPVRFLQGLVEKERERKEREEQEAPALVFGVTEETDSETEEDDEYWTEREGVRERKQARELEELTELEAARELEELMGREGLMEREAARKREEARELEESMERDAARDMEELMAAPEERRGADVLFVDDLEDADEGEEGTGSGCGSALWETIEEEEYGSGRV